LDLQQDGIIAIISGLVAGLWGMLTWRIGRGEKNTDRLFKLLDEHAKQDVEVQEKILKEIHEMHINLLNQINSRAP